MKVYITGAGVVSPLGSSYSEMMQALKEGKIGVGKIENFDSAFFPTQFCAEARKNNQIIRSQSGIDRKDLFIKMAVDELYQSSPWIKQLNSENLSLVMGSGIDHFDLVGFVNSEKSTQNFWESHRQTAYQTLKDLAAQYQVKGLQTVNVAACVASTQAMGLAYRMVQKEPLKTVITGGFDSMLSPLHYMGFYKLGALSEWEGDAQGACRPFDRNRPGIVLGEGAAAFLLQSEATAPKQSVLAEIAGYASTMDAYMVTDPDPEGKSLASAMLQALEDAKITPAQIDAMHLHGTGTHKNAIAEARAMEIVFGPRYRQIPVYSLKAQIGHLIGACGAVEFLGVIYSLLNQEIPVTPNCENPDPEVPLNVQRIKPLKTDIRYILKINAAFGGQNTAFVVKKYES